MQLWNGTTTHPAELVGFPSVDVIAEDPRTLMEQRLGWLESEWQEAVANDSYDGWHDVRMMIYGASQSMVHSTNRDRFDDSAALTTLGGVAFEHSLRKIKEGAA